MNRIDLEGRNAIVTGGAQGIGRSIVERLVASGAHVEIWDLDAGLAEETAKAVGGKTSARGIDVTDAQAVAQAAQASARDLGPTSILVTSAGIAGPNAKTWEYPLEEWARVMRINVDGTFNCCRAVIPGMIESGYGRIVTIASVAGKEGNPNASAYSASKAARRSIRNGRSPWSCPGAPAAAPTRSRASSPASWRGEIGQPVNVVNRTGGSGRGRAIRPSPRPSPTATPSAWHGRNRHDALAGADRPHLEDYTPLAQVNLDPAD
jgi:hypothetical protein